MSDARNGHRVSYLKLTRSRIIQFGGTIEILIAAHSPGDEDFAVLQKRRGVARTRFKHGRSGAHRTCGRRIRENSAPGGTGCRFVSDTGGCKKYEDTVQSGAWDLLGA